MAPPNENDPNKAVDVAVQNEKELNEELDKQAKLKEEIAAATKRQAAAAREVEAVTENIKKLEEDLAKAQEIKQSQLTEDIPAAIKLIEKQIEKEKELREEKRKAREDASNTRKSLQEEAKEYDNLNKKINDAKKEQDGFLDGFKNLGGGIGNVFKGISGMMDKVKKLEKFGKFLSDFGNTMSKIPGLGKLAGPIGNLGSVFSRLGSALAALPAFAMAAVAATLFLYYEVAKLVNEVDRLSKALSRNIGVGNVFQGQLVSTYSRALATGASLEDVSKSLEGLSQNVSAFNQNNKQLNVNLATTITKLSRVGVDANTSSKRIDFFNRALGMTLERSADVAVEIAMMGQTIGRTTKQMMNDFEQFSKRFVLFGGTAMRTFKEMSALAKATGLEVSKLVSVSEKFDTFEGAADHVAKLNSILGTNLSTLQMINMEDSKRIDMIRRQVRASVGQFSSLNKYQKLYIAQAMGINDVDEAQRLLNMSTAEYNKYLRGQDESSTSKNLDQMSKSLNTLGEELKIVGQQILLSLQPLFIFLNGMLQDFIPVMQVTGKFLRLFFTPAFLTLQVALGLLLAPLRLAFYAFKELDKAFDISGNLQSLIDALQDLYDIFHLAGSPMLYELPRYFAEGFKILGQALLSPISLIGSLSSGMQNLFGAMHPTGMNFDIEAMANLDTSKIAAGFQQIKSALVDISSVQVDGFLALKTDGASTSMVMGSEGLIKNMTEGKLTVDVKMPEMKMPDVHVKVYIGDRELRDIIRSEVDNKFVVI